MAEHPTALRGTMMDDDLYDEEAPAPGPVLDDVREPPATAHQKELQRLLSAASNAKTDTSQDYGRFIGSAAAACRRYIELQVACSDQADCVIRTFVASTDWRGNDDVEQLFIDYLRAGYINPKRAIRLPDRYVGVYPRGARPHEAAMHLGNFDTFEALLEHAPADIDLQEAASYAAALANAKHRDRFLGLLLTRSQQMMDQHITCSAASAPKSEEPTPNTRRNRRMGI